MIGAIKRRWKSKKTKVLGKGSDLSTSTDSCPPSRGFGGCEEFEKILKPPSPRQIQIHPVLEVKQQQQQQQQPQKHFKKKCSTLPPPSEATAAHPFIRVNSGRIELVNKESSPLLSLSSGKPGPGLGQIILSSSSSNGNGNDMSAVEKLRRLGGRLRNDTRRSSWCGSAFRDGPKKTMGSQMPGPVLLLEQVGRRGPVAMPDSSKGRLPSKQHQHQQSGTLEAQAQTEEMELKRYHRLLEERLGVLEGLTGTLQNWQKDERCEYERCMSELATQVSRAVALQQLMKSEVEKLQQRVVDLETHNKAMTTMIVPTLIKLHSAIGRDSSSNNPGGKNGTFTKCKDKDRAAQERLTQSLERKGNQTPKPSVKSPKQRKIDCRIPARINSCSRVSRTNPPKQASAGAGMELEKKTKVEQVESNKSSLRENEVLLSSPTTSSKSESSSSTPPKTKGVRTSSSLYSGIPRMSSPRPVQGKNKLSNSSSSPPGRNCKKNEADTPKQSNSRLPVRRNLSNSMSSPSKSKENGDRARTTTSLTFLRHNSPTKANTNSLIKSVGNCSIPSTTSASGVVAPKTGKDEGYSTMSSEALAEQENAAEKCTTQGPSFGMHKSNTFNSFIQNDNYRVDGGAGSDFESRLPKRINFTSLPTEPGRKIVSSSSTPRSTVRIIRGITSYDMEMDGEITEDPSTSTILWEDSDDSDILFLPLEMSSEAEAEESSSRSTLVPSSSNGLPSNSSSRNSESRNLVRRSRGEELVALLAAHRGRNSGGEVDPDEMEERALIEKWMRLEDVRNEVQWDDEWAWDWDGVARTHKLSRILPPPHAAVAMVSHEDDESEFWSPLRKAAAENESSCSTTPIQIDSSTWTKSKKSKTGLDCEEKLCCPSLQEDLESNSLESRMEKVLDSLGNNEVENEKGVLINAQTETPTQTQGGEVDDGSPPVIEFTPEFYHLVNYGSNLSVSDNEHSPTHGTKKAAAKIGGLRSAKWVSGKMDDKVSQTDFCSSLENLSVSSELFTECRNCLELIKKLVGETSESNSSLGLGATTTLHRDRIHEREELQTDLGTPTAWISVPKGLPTNEVNQILDILSSSESEDVLTQTK